MKTKLFFIPLLLFVLLEACNSNKTYECKCDTSFLKYNDSIIETIFSDTNFANSLSRYYKLKPLSTNLQESYRLKMSHSFSDYIQFYTLTKSISGATLEVRQYNDGFKKDMTLDKKYDIKLTSNQWNTIKKEIEKSCYWSNKLAKDKCQSCLDGGMWLLEGYDPNENNCANRKNNIDVCDYRSSGKLGKLCKLIRKYAKEEQLNIY